MRVVNKRSVALIIALPLAFSGGVAANEELPHWSYEGETGPDNWGGLHPEFVLCADGSAQTPIDIADVVVADLADPVFGYGDGETKILNNGHTIQAVPRLGNTLAIADAESELLQMHFHAPSEHTIAGVQAAAEVHFVHASLDKELTVVGVLIEEGDEDNEAWAPFIAGMTTEEGAETQSDFDWAAMLPDDHASFRYSGSLTVPPCNEGVNWVLLAETVELSADQIAAMTGAYANNARPVQPQNDRVVEFDVLVD